MRTSVGSDGAAPSTGSRCTKSVIAGAALQTDSSSAPSSRMAPLATRVACACFRSCAAATDGAASIQTKTRHTTARDTARYYAGLAGTVSVERLFCNAKRAALPRPVPSCVCQRPKAKGQRLPRALGPDLVPVEVGLIGPFHWHADVVGLLLRERGQLHADLVEV